MISTTIVRPPKSGRIRFLRICREESEISKVAESCFYTKRSSTTYSFKHIRLYPTCGAEAGPEFASDPMFSQVCPIWNTLVFVQKFTMQVGSELHACLLGKLGLSGPIYIARQLNLAEEKVQSI